MANTKDQDLRTNETGSFSFANFPEDVQLSILSFLAPPEIANFACTSKRFCSLCRGDGNLWYAMCDRRWGSKTQIKQWGNGRIAYKVLYKTLNEWENLIGFWRRCGQTNTLSSPPLIFFEWAPSFLSCSRVSPSKTGTYHVLKVPFLWMGISPDGQIMSFLDLDGQSELSSDFEDCFNFGIVDSNFVQVNVNLMGNGHVLVEESQSFTYNTRAEKRNGFRRSSSSANLREEESEDVVGGTPGSLPDCLVSEMYMQLANRTSPGADRAWRRQRRKEKERQGKRKWQPEHFVKIVDCSPTQSRPLQGLWKGFCDGINLDFYLVTYDEVGGVICRRVGDLSSCYSAPVFWTSTSTFMDSPFSREEEDVYGGRVHHCPLRVEDQVHDQQALIDFEVVSRILCMNSSYDLVPGISSANSQNMEGRIWLYRDGTFGFGFLMDHFIIDLKHIVQDGCLLDTVELCSD